MQIIILMSLLLILCQSFSYKPNGVLACGLIGFVPNGKKLPNLDWIKLIMSYNTIRGTDSCGIYINEKVIKGIGANSDIRVLLSKNVLEIDSKTHHSIIAHTRKSTRGSHTELNCHPFRIEHEGRVMYIAKNGTVTNIDEMAKKYDVDVTNIEVDSHKLGKIILEKGYDVLNYYKGGAAMIWTFEDNPNEIFIFKGASKEKYGDKELTEERPLYLITEPEGIYISSLREALDTCTNQKTTVYTFQPNTVVKIKNNKLVIVHEADRSKVEDFFIPATQITMNIPTTTVSSTNKVTKNVNYYNELTYSFAALGKPLSGAVYYLGGRYYSFDHSFKEDVSPSDNIEKYLLNGFVKINAPNENYLSYVLTHSACAVNHSEYYFYQGIMIKDPDKFLSKKMDVRYNNFSNKFEKLKQLSSHTIYPICFLHSELGNLKSDTPEFYFRGNKLKGITTTTPKFSHREYKYYPTGEVDITSKLKNDTRPVKDIEEDYDISNIYTIIQDDVENILTVTRNLTDSTTLESEILNGICPYTWYNVKEYPDVYFSGEAVLIDTLTEIIETICVNSEDVEPLVEILMQDAVFPGIIKILEQKYGINSDDFMMKIADTIEQTIIETLEDFEEYENLQIGNEGFAQAQS